METNIMSSSPFERQYLEKGSSAPRKYPNESLIAFLGLHYFHVSIAEKKNLKLLELGCGSGANLWMLAREGFDTYGVDISPTGLTLCEKMLKNWNVSATLIQGDVRILPFKNNLFDIIVDIVSLQHLNFDQHYQAYQEIFNLLKFGGRFYSYHLGENLISFKSTTAMLEHCTVKNTPEGYPLTNNGPTSFLSANEVRKALTEVGFENISVDKVIRSQSNQTMSTEYLSITADKGA